MQGLDAFNIVLVGTDFSIQRVQLDDFDFGGIEPEVEFRVPQAFQVSAGDYFLQVLPNRFQVGVKSSQISPTRIGILTRITQTFIEGYATKRSLIAVGHNFTGSLQTSLGTAADFMKYVAWREDFATAMGGYLDPLLSLTTKTKIGEEQTRTVRLEPLATDEARLLYDINFNWGEPDKPVQAQISDVLAAFPESAKLGTELVDRLSSLSPADRGQNDEA